MKGKHKRAKRNKPRFNSKNAKRSYGSKTKVKSIEQFENEEQKEFEAELMAGKRGKYKQSSPAIAENTGSATCEHCNVSAPAKSDGTPMLHYDGRVEKAWETQTYCSGPK